MKILKEGKLPNRRPNFWAGLVIDCPNCNVRVEFEDSDKPHAVGEHKKVVFIYCPTKGCDDLLYLRRG